MTSSTSATQGGSAGAAGSRRRARAEAPRSETVWVRLSPGEAAVVRAAAARSGLSVGAWVGEAAVRAARTGAADESADQPGGLSSWPELVAALVALRAEVIDGGQFGDGGPGGHVVGGQRVPDEPLGPTRAPGAALDGDADGVSEPTSTGSDGDCGVGSGDSAEGGEVSGLVRRIDVATAAAVAAVSAAGRAGRGAGRRGPVGSL